MCREQKRKSRLKAYSPTREMRCSVSTRIPIDIYIERSARKITTAVVGQKAFFSRKYSYTHALFGRDLNQCRSTLRQPPPPNCLSKTQLCPRPGAHLKRLCVMCVCVSERESVVSENKNSPRKVSPNKSSTKSAESKKKHY